MACDRRCSRGALSGNTPARMKCGDAWPASSVTRRKGRGGACSELSRAEESTFQAAAAVTFPTRRVRHGTCACLRQQPGGNAAAEQRCRHARRTAPRLACLASDTPHAGGAHPIASRSRPRVSPSAARFGIVHSVGNAARMQAQRRYASPRGTAPRAQGPARRQDGERERAPATAYTTTGVPLPRSLADWPWRATVPFRRAMRSVHCALCNQELMQTKTAKARMAAWVSKLETA